MNKIQSILGNLCDAGCAINGDPADGFGDYHTCEIPQTAQSLKQEILSSLPKKAEWEGWTTAQDHAQIDRGQARVDGWNDCLEATRSAIERAFDENN